MCACERMQDAAHVHVWVLTCAACCMCCGVLGRCAMEYRIARSMPCRIGTQDRLLSLGASGDHGVIFLDRP